MMNTEFNNWWDNDLLTEDNPFVNGTPAFWAWEGWCAKAALAQQPAQHIPDLIHHTDLSETLEYITGWNDCRQAMLAEQPEQEPVAIVDGDDHGYFAEILPDRSVKIGQLLYASAPAQQEPVGCEGAVVNGRVYADRLEHDYKFECEAGQLHMCTDWVEFRRCFEWLAQHTSPPQRTWVGLTDEDINGFVEQLCDDDHMTLRSMMRAIEAKLKEKNNG